MRLLDLFSCHGLGAWGYWRSGKFSEIVGVDIVDHGRDYPFDFIQADALQLTYDFLLDFDFIHASPPCLAYSKMTPDRSKHPRLIKPTHAMLQAAGKPYVIENVEGSSRELRPNYVVSGWDVGLPMTRMRYFHLSWMSTRTHAKVKTAAGAHMSSAATAHLHGDEITLEAAQLLMFTGIDKPHDRYLSRLTKYALEQGIPPVITKRIMDMHPSGKFLIG